jgi:peroxiredoxin
VKPFVDGGGYTFKFLLDSDGVIGKKYWVRYVPTTFLIDKKGRIVEKEIGLKDWADPEVIKKIKGLLK